MGQAYVSSEFKEKREFMVNPDGTIARDTSEIMEHMEKEILETITISSFSHRVQAAYEARNLADN